jgi:ATP-dependent RNA helicase RhlE
MKFEKYNIVLSLKKRLEEIEFKRPTDIQFKAIPHIMEGEDVLAIAQTGTGKTAAFVIPTLHRIEAWRDRPIKGATPICIVMVPTHELAIQIHKVFLDLGKYTSVKSAAIYGGAEQDSQIAKLKKGVDVLIATPGRLFDLRAQGHLVLDAVQTLILDEADQMLKLGFLKDIQDLMRRLPKKRQTLFFSATIDEEIKELAYSLVHKAIRIQISPKDPVNKNIDHGVSFVEMDDKRFFLERLIKENPAKKFLVFVRTKVRAERVVKAMERVEIISKSLHGDKEQKLRTEILDEFRSGILKVLIATDVSARGIDIPDVDYVVNYDLPDIAETYVHRVGRTGRGVKRGRAVSFCSIEEKNLLDAIEKWMDKKIKVFEISSNDYEMTLDFSDAAAFSIKDALKEIELSGVNFKQQKKKSKK